MEGKIFPRAAAFAERLWSNPSTKWYEAEPRMLHHRQRLVRRGVRADRLQPEYCNVNSGHCYWKEDDPHPKPEVDHEAEAEGEPEYEPTPKVAGAEAVRSLHALVAAVVLSVAFLSRQ